MREFKTAKIKNGYMFYDENHRIILKNPSIQAFDEFSTIQKDKNGIMYYYYDLEYYYRQKKYIQKNGKYESTYKWICKFKKRVTDFPAIKSLQAIINHIKEVDIEKEGQKVHYRDGSIGYRYTCDTEGFACEDVYEISKFYCDGDVSYSVFIGTGFTFDPDIDSFGVRFDRLSSKSFRQLKRFVDKFIEYSIEINNQATLKMVQREKDSKFIKDNKLYCFDYYNTCNKQTKENYDIDELDDVFQAGDIVDIHIAESFCCRDASYPYVKITEINETENTITVKNLRKDENEGKISVVKMDEIAYISLEENYEEMKERVNNIKQKGVI